MPSSTTSESLGTLLSGLSQSKCSSSCQEQPSSLDPRHSWLSHWGRCFQSDRDRIRGKVIAPGPPCGAPGAGTQTSHRDCSEACLDGGFGGKAGRRLPGARGCVYPFALLMCVCVHDTCAGRWVWAQECTCPPVLTHVCAHTCSTCTGPAEHAGPLAFPALSPLLDKPVFF